MTRANAYALPCSDCDPPPPGRMAAGALASVGLVVARSVLLLGGVVRVCRAPRPRRAKRRRGLRGDDQHLVRHAVLADDPAVGGGRHPRVRVGRGRGARLERPRGITPVLLPALEAAGRSILVFGGALARLASTFVALRLHHRRFPQRIGFAAHVLTGAGPPVGVPPLVSWLAPTPACALASPGGVDRPRGQGVSRPGPGPGQQRERRRTGTEARFAVPGRMTTSRGIFWASHGLRVSSPSHLRPCGCGSRTAHSARRSHRGPSRWQARGAQAPRARPLRHSKRRRGDRVLSALDRSTSAILLDIARETVFCCHWSSGARRSALPPP